MSMPSSSISADSSSERQETQWCCGLSLMKSRALGLTMSCWCCCCCVVVGTRKSRLCRPICALSLRSASIQPGSGPQELYPVFTYRPHAPTGCTVDWWADASSGRIHDKNHLKRTKSLSRKRRSVSKRLNKMFDNDQN